MPDRPPTGQEGMAVVIALLVMVVLSILGMSLLSISMTETQIGSNESDLRKAFFAAEAGIQEAMYRMRLDPASYTDETDTAYSAPADPVVVGKQGTPTTSWADPTNADFWHYDPSWAYSGSSAPGYGNYFGGNPASLISAGRTFVSSGAVHGVGGVLANANLTNTASDPRLFSVSIAPVVGYAGGCWQYVDQFGAPLKSCATVATNPMFRVTSTGTAKNSQKILSTMIRRININPDLQGTLTANSDVEVTSASAVVDGRNHDCNGNNPSGTDGIMAASAPGTPPDITTNNAGNLVCDAGSGVTNCGGTSAPFPSTIGALLLGPTASTSEITALNTYLESIKVSPASAPDENDPPFNGILYVNGNYVQPPDGSTGILIVHNATNTANLGNWNGGTFKGLVIADGINKINGNVTIIGGIFGFGSSSTIEVDITAGTPQMRYSKCIIDGLSQNFPFQIEPGTWHEQ